VGILEKSAGLTRLTIVVGTAFLLVLLGTVFWQSHQPNVALPGPSHGYLDLSHWSGVERGTVSLAGEWQYFDKTWARDVPSSSDGGLSARVPGPWPVFEPKSSSPRMNGFGTYVLRLKLPAAPDGEDFAIDTGYVLSAYRLYANGKLVVARGQPAESAANERAYAYSAIATLPPGTGDIELKLEISNHLTRFGGTFVAPRFGLEKDLIAATDFIRALSMFLVGAMVFAALYHLVAFSLNPTSIATAWFGLFAALLCVRTLFIDPLASYSVPLIGQDWVWRLDFSASILLLPASYQFLMLSFPRQITARFTPWIFGFCLGAVGCCLVGGPVVGEFAMKVFEVVALVAIAYLTSSLIRAVRQKEAGSALTLCGWILSASACCHDILIDNGVISGVNLIPFGFLAFFLCLSGMLVARVRDAFRRSENVSKQLLFANEQLESAVHDRTQELQDRLADLSNNQSALESAKQQAISANIAKSRFLATMSHELRTPLNSILGFSEIIRDERLGGVGDARYAEYASYIHDSGAHLLNLIGDILDLSRIEAGKVELTFEELPIAEIADAALRHAATRERKGIESVTLRLATGLPNVIADRRSLMQVIINLLSNAMKFTPDGGQVVLSAFLRGDGGITIQVADTGIGMSSEDIPKALSAFTQVDDGLSRTHEGTGLGLAIVKSLVELHGGILAIESAKGRGTTVRAELPVSRTVVKDLAAFQRVRLA
jgi:signal transduction histidine kinase